MVTTDYINGFDYKDGVLQTFPQPEGYVENKLISNGGRPFFKFVYHYIYKDHLGNTRLVYADLDDNGTINPATEILEENNYYPFGLKHKGYNEITNSNRSEAAEKYKFNGMEWQPELGLDLYDFGARNYDAALGRWLNVDPLAEQTMQPYAYANNNPIRFVDPTGMIGEDVIIKGNKANEAFGELQSSVSNELNLTMNTSGKLSASRIDSNAPLSQGANDLLAAVNDQNVTVTLNASDDLINSTGTAPLTGSFMGNSTNLLTGQTTASQEINVPFMQGMDKVMVSQGKISRQGQSTLHETTEAYVGALIARRQGILNTPAATIKDQNNPGSVYSQAHNLVVPQSGTPNSYFIDSSGKAGNVSNPNFTPVRMEYWIGNPETKFHTIPIPK